MKISAAEAQWDTCEPCAMSLSRSAASPRTTRRRLLDPDSHALSWVATGSFDGQVQGLTELNRQQGDVRAGQLHAAGADDLLEHAGDGLPGSLIALVALAAHSCSGDAGSNG